MEHPTHQSPVHSFESDYNNGAHHAVMQALAESNAATSASYGDDEWSQRARQNIRKACQTPEADIFFLVGGTQTNATVIAAMTPLYAGVVAVETGHINVHEAGAVEATGHKVLTLPHHDGKMLAKELEALIERFRNDPSGLHTVHPGMVYITQPTELGTVYTATEIVAIHAVCKRYAIPLYIDGARLGYALASPACDFDLPWMAHHCDAFYIGGTKMGALCGEAVVFPRGNAPRHFFSIIKQHGALLAKSRLAGVQFEALFTDDLYLSIGLEALYYAQQLVVLFAAAGIPTHIASPTNQQFFALTRQQMATIGKHVRFETWEPLDADHTVCRFVTSWATTDADMEALRTALDTL